MWRRRTVPQTRLAKSHFSACFRFLFRAELVDDRARLVFLPQNNVGLGNAVIRMLRQVNDQAGRAVHPENASQIPVDGKRSNVASQKNSAPAHFNLKASLQWSRDGNHLEAGFAQ